MDDRKGRTIAQKHGLRVRGILGLLKEFKRTGIIISSELLKRELDEIGE